MQLLKPVDFLESHLISSNAVEAYAAYSSGTTYAKDDYVDYGTHIYISLVNSNLNHQPDISPTFWLLVGPDNKHAMFDNQVNTQTTSSSPLTVVVKPLTYINSLYFGNLEADAIRVTITDNGIGANVYDSGIVSLVETIITDWYMYFYESSTYKQELILTDIPPYLNAVITMQLTGSATVKIGNFVYGNIYDLGMTQYGAASGIRDFSVKTTDDYGNTTFVERAFSKRMQASIMTPSVQLPAVYKLLSEVRAKPSVWIGSQDSNYSSLVVYGFYKDFNIDISYPSYALCSLEVEGLI